MFDPRFVAFRILAVNTANPLGSGGDIAHAYAALLRQMWGGRLVYAAPAAFKAAVGRHLPQFAGREQQDNQEFLTALLDRLHEDLNQVRINQSCVFWRLPRPIGPARIISCSLLLWLSIALL